MRQREPRVGFAREQCELGGSPLNGALKRRNLVNLLAPLLVVGDFNSYQFSDGFTDVVGLISGTSADGIDAAASANVLSSGSEAQALAGQSVAIDQGITGDATAESAQDSAIDSSDAVPADGTVPSGNSWPSDISWNRLYVEPGLAGSLITDSRESPSWPAW